MKKNKEKIEEETCSCGCGCDETCDCGCNEGKECTCDETCDCGCNCDETCDCETTEESGCSGSCSECCGCSDIDENMLLEMLNQKNNMLEEKYMRLQAEFLNYKTRTQNEVGKLLKYEGEEFIKQVINIKDNFERAVSLDDNDLSDEVSKFLSGFKIILGNLTTVFDEFEIKEIDCLGKEFDPNIAEAVITEHNPEKPENVVLEVLTKGYMFKDKIIRHACVKVNK